LENLISGLTVVVEKMSCSLKSMADHKIITTRTDAGEEEEALQPQSHNNPS